MAFAWVSSRSTLSVWYADRKNYADYLFADLKVREYLQDKLKARP